MQERRWAKAHPGAPDQQAALHCTAPNRTGHKRAIPQAHSTKQASHPGQAGAGATWRRRRGSTGCECGTALKATLHSAAVRKRAKNANAPCASRRLRSRAGSGAAAGGAGRSALPAQPESVGSIAASRRASSAVVRAEGHVVRKYTDSRRLWGNVTVLIGPPKMN